MGAKNLGRGCILVLTLVLILSVALPVSAQQVVYVVKAGDTVASIAARYRVTVDSLVRYNGILNQNVIFVGQRLYIPPTGGPVTPPQPATRYHTVQPNETLKIIAARYGTTWQALAAVNNLANPNYIYAGQVLAIPPIGGPVVTPPPVVQPPPIVGGRYIVQPGDTLYRIGARFGVNIWDIARANGILNLNQIYAGQALIIPGR